MRDVAIVSFVQRRSVRAERTADDTEMLMPVINEAIEKSGIPRKNLGFTVSGSCDYLIGRPFSFVMALDAVGAWPPIQESHVEMDGAWALYEAWVRLQHGDIDAALVYSFGKSSLGKLPEVLALQLDPYTLTPLWPDAISLAALQARALLDSGRASEKDFAEVAARNRKNAKANPNAQLAGDFDVEKLLAAEYLAAPLRKHDCPPISDGCCAMILAAGDVARKAVARPAWIRGIDHRIEAHQPGSRDLTRSPSTAIAARKAGVHDAKIDVAELHAPFSHQELILRDALQLPASTQINPSGGALAANPMMSAGLIRLGEAAARIHDGSAKRTLAHATSGPCLQQNLVAVLEAR